MLCFVFFIFYLQKVVEWDRPTSEQIFLRKVKK